MARCVSGVFVENVFQIWHIPSANTLSLHCNFQVFESNTWSDSVV